MERAKARRRRVALAILGALGVLGFAAGAVMGSGGSGDSGNSSAHPDSFKPDGVTEVGIKAEDPSRPALAERLPPA
jgi:hypothetical protein